MLYSCHLVGGVVLFAGPESVTVLSSGLVVFTVTGTVLQVW